MAECETEPKIIEKKELVNKVRFTLFDLSRRLAGDRWQIKLCCELQILFTDQLLPGFSGNDVEVANAFKDQTKNIITHSLIKERNFISEQEKERVMNELVTQIYQHNIAYFQNPSFPKKLVEKHYNEFKQKYRLRATMKEHDKLKDNNQEDEGPADFSSCFKD